VIEGAPAPFFPINRERPRGKKGGKKKNAGERGEGGENFLKWREEEV